VLPAKLKKKWIIKQIKTWRFSLVLSSELCCWMNFHLDKKCICKPALQITSVDSLLQIGRKSFRGVAFITYLRLLGHQTIIDDWWTKGALDTGKERKAMTSNIMLVFWKIWKECNARGEKCERAGALCAPSHFLIFSFLYLSNYVIFWFVFCN
jgi:hypothetical protein